jgi:protein-tyrosine phosphatase
MNMTQDYKENDVTGDYNEIAFMGAVELDGAYNVRDLGGLRIADGGETRYGTFFRGDSLDDISNNDEEILFKDHGIRAIVDLRTSEEAHPKASVLKSVAYRRVSPIAENRVGREPFPSDDPQKLAQVYLSKVNDGRSAIAVIFDTLGDYASLGDPCIFQCAAGRDRTGVIAALLLAHVNVCDQDIELDYVRSNRHAGHVTQRLENNPIYSNDNMPPSSIILLKRETIRLFLSLIRESYGSSTRLLLSCGVPAQTLDKLNASLRS